MRKCPNCRKPIPVGARRCVYCRVLIGENEESTRLGMGGGHELGNDDEMSRNNTTAFGHPGGGPRGGREFSDQESRQFDDMPHQTMLGLGSISGDDPRAMNRFRATEDNAPQRTIAGMPGISVEKSKIVTRNASEGLEPLGGVSAGYPAQNFGRSPSISNSQKALQSSRFLQGDFQRSMMSSSVRSSQNFEPISADMMPGANSPEHAYASAVSKPSIERVSVPSVAPEPVEPKQEPVEDLLAGMPGVVPSSLVDEEFVDLTSKLFGDEFAAVNDADDEDEDGLDFDAPSETPVVTPVVTPAPSPAKPADSTADKKEDDESASQKADAKKSDAKKSDAKKSDAKKSDDKKSDAKKSGAKKSSVKKSGVKKAVSLPQKEVMSLVALGVSCAAALFIVIWIAMTASSLASCGVLAAMSILVLAIDASFFKIRTKLKPKILTGVMFGGVALLLVGLIASSAVANAGVMLLAILCQIVSAACCFLKK